MRNVCIFMLSKIPGKNHRLILSQTFKKNNHYNLYNHDIIKNIFADRNNIFHTCKISKTIKYALANRCNCSNKFLGRNVRTLYLEVLI